MAHHVDELAANLEELQARDPSNYHLLGDIVVEAVSGKAVLIKLGVDEAWFPFSQLRCHGTLVYASQWILEQKGWA